MEMNNISVKINWTVWDNNPTVCWTSDGRTTTISMRLPPIAVSHLSNIQSIAIVGNFDEFGSSNLMFYSYDGKLIRKFAAPNLGSSAQFVGVEEITQGLQVIVGFRTNSGSWAEQAGVFNAGDGTVSNLHRSC